MSEYEYFMREEMQSTDLSGLKDTHNMSWCETLNVNISLFVRKLCMVPLGTLQDISHCQQSCLSLKIIALIQSNY